MVNKRLAVESWEEPSADKSVSSDLYEQILQAAVRHLKACCSDAAFTDAEVREFLIRQPQEDGTLYTDDEYMFMNVDDHELASHVAPIWRLDTGYIKQPLTLNGLSFICVPGMLERIQVLLDRLYAVNFDDCDFYIDSLPLNRCATRFEQCRFHQDWQVVTNVSGSSFEEIFQTCEFSGTVYLTSEIDIGFLNNLSIFKNCRLHALEIDRITLQAQLFDNDGSYIQTLQRLTLRDATLERAVALEHAQIDHLCFQNSRLRKPLMLSYAQIQEATFTDTVFVDAIAMDHSQITCLLMKRCDCRHVVDMGNSALGQQVRGGVMNQTDPIRFSFTTFHQNVSFRGIHWHVPLDMQNTNRKQSLDFKGFRLAKAARQGTDRETFRIIRHSFDSVGNHVDAGRCYALEMEAYRHEMRGFGPLAERFLLWCNSWMSYHGQSYLRPVGWILLGMLLFTLLRYAHQANWLYRVYLPANDILAAVAAGLNAFARSLIIFKPLMVNGMEMLSLLFGLLFSTLTWQAVVAMRRHTRK